ncbi:hypothetical protein HOLleu_29863 [Holothuria leucospilota]|uniref:Uncharacterized protein n=1 Tax=Holothuria leucospilota TaxID=206669 RepID=A0A9Q1GYQ8_HOLLE|nr:hypothetical protein HOLleu_29863 [Holothuria leucospilota]
MYSITCSFTVGLFLNCFSNIQVQYSTESSRLADVDGRYDNLLSATILDHQQFYSKFLIVEDRKINSSNPNLESVY